MIGQIDEKLARLSRFYDFVGQLYKICAAENGGDLPLMLHEPDSDDAVPLSVVIKRFYKTDPVQAILLDVWLALLPNFMPKNSHVEVKVGESESGNLVLWVGPL